MRNRQQFIERSPRRRGPSWNAVVIAAAVAFLGIAVLVASRGARLEVAAAATATGGADLVVAESTFADGRARFYSYTTGAGQAVRFFVMKSADGVVRAAIDGCVVCYRQRLGYRQEGDRMVCNKCGQAFPSSRINEVTGGCNPIPLTREAAGGQVIVRATALEAAAIHY
jgi:uncharacterized membrane protein